ncbi:MAG: adenosylmethionine--8-amino-7-oxononanoate transaminase [Cyclobacteriaceae bacterium]|nr:adenosylmethionine--8-amino-7-oxononanoate transaminase [Cyclobacteriaceae bacterium]
MSTLKTDKDLNWDEIDAKHVWHPFTPLRGQAPPLLVQHARESLLYLENGKIIIDAVSSWWVNIHGHSHPLLAEALYKQALELEHVIFAGFTHKPAIQLSDALLKQLDPKFSKVFFSDNGSTAIEVSLKMAMQYHNINSSINPKIVAFKDAYHGDTFGAMAVGERGTFNIPFEPYFFDILQLPSPGSTAEKHILTEAKKLFSEPEVGIFIFEPLVQGAGGMQMYSAQLLDRLIELAHQNNVICIADEVMTGFGRTGKLFACNHLRNQPDIICLSKGLTGGAMPLSVSIASQFIVDAFDSDARNRTFFHGHSFTGNPLACAVAIASLELLLSKERQEDMQRICSSHSNFAKSLKLLDNVENIRQCGTILAFDWKNEEETSYFNSKRNFIYNFFIDRGVLLRPLGNTIYFMPPYCTSQAQLEKVYEAVLEFFKFTKHMKTTTVA